jgi:Tfp pilus assembly protein PilZ
MAKTDAPPRTLPPAAGKAAKAAAPVKANKGTAAKTSKAAAIVVETPLAPKKKPDRIVRHLRAPIEIRVELTVRNQSFTTTSRNIAVGGLSFESQQDFRIGDLVNVLLYIPVRKELELLKAASEVVWVEDLKGSWMCGAAFRKFAPGDERRLREWLLETIRAQKAATLALPPPLMR